MTDVPGAELSRCLMCGSAGFLGTQCDRCFVPRPPFDDSIVAAKCARCTTPLEILSVGPGTGTRVFACRSCRSTFLPARAWSTMFADPSVAAEIEVRVPLPTIRVDQATPLVTCPVCAQEMDRARFAATSSSIIDVCRFQHGVWVDAGEVRRIVAFEPSHDERPLPHRDRPEIAASILQQNRDRLGHVKAASSRAPSVMLMGIAFLIGLGLILAGLKVMGRDCRNLDPRVEDPQPR